jgi:hypothetical protein
MSTVDRLYDLLPVVYRQRDLEQGGGLQVLLRVIAEQVNLLESNIAQLYENWFIETCEDWVVPYLADLIGYRPVHPLADSADAKSSALNEVLVPRREVGNTIGYRRRKGTLALLQDLAIAVTRWPARVVEFDRYLSVIQSLDHPHLAGGRYVDLHAADSIDRLSTPFDTLSHSIDIRTVESPYSQGRYNIPSVAVFLWRLKSYSVTHSPAYCLEEAGNHCFTFSILGNDVPLFNRPDPRTESSATGQPTEETEVPEPIRRRPFGHDVDQSGTVHIEASEKYYGEGKSVTVWAPHWANTEANQPIPAAKIVPANLSEWRYQPRAGRVALDPELGRLAFPIEQLPEHGVWVSYAYGFSADIGGGEYHRPEILSGRTLTTYRVGSGAEFSNIHEAYERWHNEEPRPRNAVIEITDSGVYQEQVHIALREDQRLELRGAHGARPVISLIDWHASHPDALTISGEAGSAFVLDGILITGRGIEIRGALENVTIRHSTLVPGWALHQDCTPRHPAEPSLSLTNTSASVNIRNSILGSIQVIQESGDVDPLQIEIADSIVDATSNESLALGASDELVAPAVLTIYRSTFFGRVQTHSIALAENCIFNGELMVGRRQQGCMRFCYVPHESRTPRRYHCQPDLVDHTTLQRAKNDQLDAEHNNVLRRAERLRVTPDFLDTKYGTSNYCRLARNCALEITTGASDQSEMGVFHDLFQTQQENNLRARLAEYTPAEIDADIIFAT